MGRDWRAQNICGADCADMMRCADFVRTLDARIEHGNCTIIMCIIINILLAKSGSEDGAGKSRVGARYFWCELCSDMRGEDGALRSNGNHACEYYYCLSHCRVGFKLFPTTSRQ